MSINLCIDWGNTNIKAAVFNDETVVNSYSFKEDQAEQTIAGILQEQKPEKAIMCSVVNASRNVEQLLREKIKSFIKLDNNTRLPIMNAYTSQESLGYDRVALATAAHMLFPDKNNLVVSLGTCITYNFVQKTRTFRGGAISPGLHMRIKAMHHFTDLLPEIKADGELLLLGYDTETCLRSGTVFGMAAEIDGMVAEFAAKYPDFNAILTGGDAPFFATKLKSKIFADPDLLLKGLNLIVKYNVSIPR
jgi:type III pantothenate kinase